MKLVSAAALGIAMLAVPALAVEVPKPGSADPRIKSIDYDARQVVRIAGSLRTATQILFSPEETILHAALGDTSGWEVAPERNVLFLKPTAPRAPTNLIVTTDRGGGQTRHYTFELIAQGAAAPRQAYFVVQFRYPEAEAARLQAALSAQAQALEARILQLKLDRGVLEGRRNLDYVLQGSVETAPSEVSDNGRFTVLRFPGAQPIPAVFVVETDGSEALTPFDVRGEFVVVHRVAAQLRLRRGRQVTCVLNGAHDPYGAPARSGTASAGVERTVPEGRVP